VAAAGPSAAGSAGVAQAATKKPAQVVRAWSAALNADDNEAAARLFAKNARVLQPGVAVRLATHALALGFNDALPCAGTITRLQVHGDRVTATFLLGERPKHTCDGPGQKAAALFVVEKGKIVLWQQVAVPAEPSA
jgi:limonene-1,2-epoxide hydrolase